MWYYIKQWIVVVMTRNCLVNRTWITGIPKAEMVCFDNYKKKKYHPTIIESKLKVLAGQEKEIWAVAPDKCGKDLPSGRTLFDSLCTQRGRMKLLQFFADHKKVFSTLWIVVHRYASWGVVEVGCERFFGISGYISSPRQTRLCVRNYERLAMLASIFQNVYIDPELVGNEYLRRCKAGA